MTDLVKSKTRLREVSWCRKAICFLIRKHTRYSLKEIGYLLGNRDHSTISYAIDDIVNLPTHDKFYKPLVKMVDLVEKKYFMCKNPKFDKDINR
jgi:chromosomal replication initiation ATPase DnaA